MGATAWIVIPLLGGVIGYLTNRIAVKMIFRPLEPVSVLGLRVQGLIGLRKHELAASIGRVVGAHLVQHEDVVEALGRIDLQGVMGRALDRGLEPKLAELRRLPLIGGFLTAKRVADLRDQILDGLLQNQDAVVAELERAIEVGLDVQELVTRKVEGFPVERVEALVLEVASRELRSIEVLGGILGVLIGFAQVALLSVL